MLSGTNDQAISQSINRSLFAFTSSHHFSAFLFCFFRLSGSVSRFPGLLRLPITRSPKLGAPFSVLRSPLKLSVVRCLLSVIAVFRPSVVSEISVFRFGNPQTYAYYVRLTNTW